MKKSGWIIAGILTLALVFAAFPADAAEKIGFVNVQEILATSNAGKKELEDIRKGIEKTKAMLQEKETELKKLDEELKKQKPLLKEEVFKEKELSFQKKVRDYQILVKDSNEELNVKQQEVAKKMLPEIQKLVQAIGEKEKYTMIIDSNAFLQAFNFGYFAKENDLTKRVLEEFNKTYKPKK